MSVVLVTGGNGFIGKHLVSMLAEQGRRVRVYDIRPSFDHPEGVEAFLGDIADEAAVCRAMKGVEEVYHLAANPNLWHKDKSDFERTNLLGTQIVLRQARKHNVRRTVYTSTESILKSYRIRQKNNKELINEVNNLSVDDMPGPYCRSKFFAERDALQAAARGQDVVIVNPTLPTGPGDRLITPPTRMILDLLNKTNLPVYLECQLNMIDVRDVAWGHIMAMEKGKSGERYILGHENITLTRLLNMLEIITGISMPKVKISYSVAWCAGLISEFIADYITHSMPKALITGIRLARTPLIFDTSKSVHELGLKQRPLEESLKDMILWLDQQGYLKEKVRISRSIHNVKKYDAVSLQ